jgi:hypothetical protein
VLLFGQVLYAAATLVRFVRLYVSLGKARPPSAVDLAVAHCLGVMLGYFFGAFWYELTVLLFFALLQRKAFVAACAGLLLLRGLDATLLLLLTLYAASWENARLMLFFLSVLLLGLGIFFVSFDALLRRVEKKLLEFPHPAAGITAMLQSLHAVRRQILLLSWNRPGSLSILIMLTLGGWFLEWLAFFRLRPTAEQALADMLGRVMGSLHVTAGSNAGSALGALQPGVWGLLLLAAALLSARLIRVRPSRRSS